MEVEYIKEVANERIEEIFEVLGVQVSKKGTEYLSMACPIHAGDNTSGMSYSLKSKTWTCWTRHCEKDAGNDIFGFICALQNKKFMEVVEWLCVLLGLDPNASLSKEDIENLIIKKFVKKKEKRPIFKIYDESVIDKLIPHDYLLKRGFTQEAIDFFQCGYCENKYSLLYDRIVFPVYNEKNKILGFTGRVVSERCEVCKKWHLGNGDCDKATNRKWNDSYNFPKSNVLFNYNNAIEHIRENGSVVIVEGILDVMRLWESGIKNCVATMMSSLGFNQAKLMYAAPINNVIIALDTDKAGTDGRIKTEKMLVDYFNVRMLDFPEGKKDFGEMDTYEITNLFGRKPCS